MGLDLYCRDKTFRTSYGHWCSIRINIIINGAAIEAQSVALISLKRHKIVISIKADKRINRLEKIKSVSFLLPIDH